MDKNGEVAPLSLITIERNFSLSRSDGSVENLTFASALDLVKYLSNEDKDDFIPLQTMIAKSIDGHPETKAWQQARKLL